MNKPDPLTVKDSPAETGGNETTGVVGINAPLVVPEAGHEGARAVYESRAMCEGRLVVGDATEDKFQQYDNALDRSGGPA